MEKNLTMLTDFYQLTMANGYFNNGMKDTIAYFDMFFRKVPDDGGYAIMAGVEQLVEYLEDLRFTDEDIAYLEGRGCFSKGFLDYLKNFRFECDVWAIPEGEIIFPGEPIVTVRGPIIQAQFIETMLLLTINHQSLIATKASRMVRAAEGRALARDMHSRILRMEEWTGLIAERAPEIKEERAAVMRERLNEALEAVNGLDENRFLQEVTILADRLDVTEDPPCPSA